MRIENPYRLSIKFQMEDTTGEKWFLVTLPSRAAARRMKHAETGQVGWSGPALEQKIPSTAFTSDKDFLKAFSVAAATMAIKLNTTRYPRALTKDNFDPDDVAKVAYEEGVRCIRQVLTLERVAKQRQAEALIKNDEVRIEVERIEE